MNVSAVQDLATAVDALLPQTQCGKCGYAGCRPYADAIARRDTDINRCPPGGEDTVREIAALLGVAPKPLDPACGAAMPGAVAVIDEARCIGCTLCLGACPVDAIVGAAKLMHTVIRSECTGCELCLPPCPVDCITLVPTAPVRDPAGRRADAARARRRHEARVLRLQRRREEKKAERTAHAAAQERKRETIRRAVERARERLAARPR